MTYASSTSSPINPRQWGEMLSAAPVLTSEGAHWRNGLIRRWTGTSPDMAQPPLDHHYIVLHLGGPKRVTRCGGGETAQADVREGSLTVVPAGSSFDWQTEGPIDFAHLYIDPRRLGRAVTETFDRDAAGVSLLDRVGEEDPLLAALLRAMLEEVSSPEAAGSLYLDVLFEAAIARLVRAHSTLPKVANPAPLALAPYRLRRVLEYVEAHLAEDVDLAGLAEAAGLSRYHFSRAFQRATGASPYAYVTRRRIETAKGLLRAADAPLAEVARQVGFNSPGQFSTMFKRFVGCSPSRYRNAG